MPGILPMKMIRVGSTTQSRIAQACDRCRSKKIRCDGVRPCCTQCENVGFECKTSDKLSRRAFPRGYTESLEDRVRGLEAEVRELKDLLDEKDEKIDMLSRIHSFSPSRKCSTSLSPGNAAQVKADVEAAREEFLHVEIPAPVQPAATSIGSSTTSAFLQAFEQQLQEREKQSPNISTTTLLPENQPARQNATGPAKTPPRILSDQYINVFFQEWQPLLPILHRPTFLRVYEQYLSGPDIGSWHSNKLGIAQLFLIFEIAALSSGSQTKHLPSYESQWRKALYSTTSAPTLSTIQCHVLAQLCYLLRADYSHLARHRGIAVGMCHELGLHQNHKYHSLSTLEAETRKRVFWCQYVLDKFTSAATGAPTLMREADISTEYPADVDDENINSQGFSPTLPGELTKVSSALALFRVSRTLSKTLEHLYPAKASYQLSLTKLHALSDELDQWSEELPDHLRLRFCNDKPATNLISCRSPLLSLAYFYTRSLLHRPLLCHASGNAQSAATIVLAAAGKHVLQILDLLNERRMNYTFPLNKRELILTSGFSILWQSLDLEEDGKLVKDNQKSLSLVLGMLVRENQAAAIEFQRVAVNLVSLAPCRLPSPKHINIDSSATKLINNMSPPTGPKSKSTRKQLQAIASRLSSFSTKPRPDEASRRATVPQTSMVSMSHSLSPQPRAGSSLSLSSTQSAPAISLGTPSPNYMAYPQNKGATSINLDYFPIGEELNDALTSPSSVNMLPPKRQTQMSQSLTDASWESLLTGFDGSNNMMMGNVTPNGHSHMGLAGSEWMQEGWTLPAMDLASKAPVPQSLLSFSGESMTSGDDLLFSASSNNGSTSTNESLEIGETFKGMSMPVDDDFDFHEIAT